MHCNMNAPRPLPLFLELLRRCRESDPERTRDALAGLRRYRGRAARADAAAMPEIAREHGAACAIMAATDRRPCSSPR